MKSHFYVLAGAIVVGAAGLGASEGPAAPSRAAQHATPDTAAALRVRGLDLGYNLDHAEALATFKEAVAADPDAPAGYRLAAATIWITVLFQQGIITVEDYLGQARASVTRSAPAAALDAAFHDYLRQAQRLAERRLRQRPAHAEAAAACQGAAGRDDRRDGQHHRSIRSQNQGWLPGRGFPVLDRRGRPHLSPARRRLQGAGLARSSSPPKTRPPAPAITSA